MHIWLSCIMGVLQNLCNYQMQENMISLSESVFRENFLRESSRETLLPSQKFLAQCFWRGWRSKWIHASLASFLSGWLWIGRLNGPVWSELAVKTCSRLKLLLNRSVTALIRFRDSYVPSPRSRSVEFELTRYVVLLNQRGTVCKSTRIVKS